MEKIKSFSELKNKCDHNQRLINVVNADQSNDVKIIFGSMDLINDVKEIFKSKNINIDKIRKDAVIATELVVSLSPSFFKEGELDYKNKFNSKNTKRFINIAKQHIISKFGENVISAYLHLDESVPHIHFFLLPLICDDSSSGSYRLSCRDYFNKSSLISLQSDYCKEFNDSLPDEYIFEYKRNSKAKHTTLLEYYKNANRIQEIIEQKDNKIKSLKNEIAVSKYLSDTKIESLETKNHEFEEELRNINLIIDDIRRTIIKFMKDKIHLFGNGVLKYLNIPTEKSETEKMIEHFKENELNREKNENNYAEKKVINSGNFKRK